MPWRILPDPPSAATLAAAPLAVSCVMAIRNEVRMVAVEKEDVETVTNWARAITAPAARILI